MEIREHVARRLDDDKIMWLTTVRGDGRPQSSPVWFLWEGDDRLVVYSLDDTARVANIATNPQVAMNLNSDAAGGSVVSMEGTARIVRDHPAAKDVPRYVAKYQELLDGYGWSAEYFSTDYSVPILITIDRLRASQS